MSASAPPRAGHAPPAPLPRSGDYRWVTLWGVPLRTMHWLAALCIVVLAVTGLYIGKPYFMTTGQASSHYLMGWMRFLHFAAAGVFVMTAIIRAYWLFAGNRYERWKALFPSAFATGVISSARRSRMPWCSRRRRPGTSATIRCNN